MLCFIWSNICFFVSIRAHAARQHLSACHHFCKSDRRGRSRTTCFLNPSPSYFLLDASQSSCSWCESSNQTAWKHTSLQTHHTWLHHTWMTETLDRDAPDWIHHRSAPSNRRQAVTPGPPSWPDASHHSHGVVKSADDAPAERCFTNEDESARRDLKDNYPSPSKSTRQRRQFWTSSHIPQWDDCYCSQTHGNVIASVTWRLKRRGRWSLLTSCSRCDLLTCCISRSVKTQRHRL